MISWTVSNSPWMSPSAPIIMICGGGQIALRGQASRAGRASQAGLTKRSSLPCQPRPACLPLSGLLFGIGGRHEEVSLVPDELILAVDRQLVVLAHENGADRARLFA